MKRWPEMEEKMISAQYNTVVSKLRLKLSVWRVLAVAFSCVILLLVIAIGWIGSRPRPGYIVEVMASTGEAYLNPNTVYNASEYVPSDAVIRNALNTFVTKLRSVSTDRSVTSRWLMDVYAMMDQHAADQIREYVQSTDPVNRGLNEKVEVVVFNISQLSESSYQVDWRETVTDARSGALTSDQRYRGILQTAFYTPRNDQQLESNPLGFYVTDISISSIKEV